MKKTNGWDEYKRLILSELEENKRFRAEVRDVLGKVKDDVSGLKVKATAAGGLAGIIGTGIVSAFLAFFQK